MTGNLRSRMEIFNVHLFEFILIAGLALVLFGPERLPEIGRFAGKQVARFLAWQQQSPELQMINEMRNEFEREIAQLRDELIYTRKQLDVRNDVQAIVEEVKSVGQEVQTTLQEVTTATDTTKAVLEAQPATKPAIRPPAHAPVPATTAVASTASTDPSSSGIAQPLTDEDRALFAEMSQPNPPPSTHNGTTQPPLSADELADLVRRLNTLAAEFQAIVFQLQARGVLNANWQPAVPSPAVSEESVTP